MTAFSINFIYYSIHAIHYSIYSIYLLFYISYSLFYMFYLFIIILFYNVFNFLLFCMSLFYFLLPIFLTIFCSFVCFLSLGNSILLTCSSNCQQLSRRIHYLYIQSDDLSIEHKFLTENTVLKEDSSVAGKKC